MKNTGQLIYKTTLKRTYGFTDKQILQLGAPDKQGVNMYYHTGPRTSLYRVSRVEEFVASQTESVRAQMAERQRRNAEKAALAEQKMIRAWQEAERENQRYFECSPEDRETALRWADHQVVEVQPLPGDMRAEAAKQAAGSPPSGRGAVRPDHLVSRARHTLTNYEGLLAALDRQPFNPGAREAAYQRLKERVNAAVKVALADDSGVPMGGA